MRGFIPWIGGGETWACHKESVRGVRTCGRKSAVAVPRARGTVWNLLSSRGEMPSTRRPCRLVRRNTAGGVWIVRE